MSTPAVPRAIREVHEDWLSLSQPTGQPDAFEPAMLAGLPEPARRWLTHAIAPGTPLFGTVDLTMRGQIRLGAWRPFTARQVLAPPSGFIWAATARLFGLPVRGFDRYSRGSGQMRWRLLGLIPVMAGTGSDVTHSAAGRLAGEAVLLPTAFRHARWSPGPTADTATATWRIDQHTQDVDLQIDAHGRLRSLVEQRWGNPDRAPFGRYPFGVTVEAEGTFAGITIPARFRAGWWWGTDRQDDGEFFRAHITDATFR
jgi:hypothetical protein